MTATKVKPKEVIGDDLPILKWQVNRIMKNAQYKVDIKDEWVQWVTADVNRTSLRSITQAEAKKVIVAQEGLQPLNQPKQPSDNWGLFDNSNQQHRTILSHMRTAQWTVPNDKWGEVPDLDRLSNFLKSDKSPVNKPLKKMEPEEVSKIIEAFKGIVKSIYK
ncbi:hypothetical protein QWY99_01130 [Flavobacterium branchiarum]|uniref:Uncharacterized protein n=1 Tax=Flavobacterium branchiarum TaxID=1114870 RepID=A0ABV5FR35_9FLAO|nr:hypothetical protein [Flavobacterium branchiarum]MDN3671668.1 hypothetical protein [Flavobacterium branchiarum]